MQGRRVLPIPMFHYNVNVLIECHEKAQKALHRELTEHAAQHLGDVWLADAEKFCGFDLFETAPFHQRANLADQLRLDQVLACIRQACLSLAICSAYPSRREFEVQWLGRA